MQNYELLFVLPGTLSDEETTPTVEKVKGIIEKNNGIDYFLEAMDKKRLAYPINHIRYGYFYLAFFKAEPKDAVQMQKELKVMPELLRALLQKYDPKKQTIRKIDFGERAEQADYNAAIPAAAAPARIDTESAVQQTVAKEPCVVRAQAPVFVPVKKEDKKISLEEIDKKLDEILEIDLGSV